jgi:hypothetical protein
MSEEIKEVSLIDQLKADLNMFIQQRESFQTNLHQAIGAIYATEKAIQKLFESDKPKEPELPII